MLVFTLDTVELKMGIDGNLYMLAPLAGAPLPASGDRILLAGRGEYLVEKSKAVFANTDTVRAHPHIAAQIKLIAGPSSYA